MKIAVVLGTRPEIIKMSPIIRECNSLNLDYIILHTGQHYSYILDKIFFDELNLPESNYNLNIGSGTHGAQTGRMMERIEEIFLKETPDIILVEGDTNTVLAAALVSAKLKIKLGHVEAGLRSYDRNMPEEVNRVITDHISDFLFAPTEVASNNLIKEGIDSSQIFITGNTIVDAVYQNLEIAEIKANPMARLGITAKEYLLISTHRQENVDSKQKLENILAGLDLIYQSYSIPIIFPIHPRTLGKLREFSIMVPKGIKVVNPLNFLDFLLLESSAKMVLTDSGGVQEETCILGVPCVTLRENTERPETLQVGSNILAGTNPEKILKSFETMLRAKKVWKNPFGDGNAAKRIIEAIRE
jgi:UDP-N-acetylglucosamine 2-epimerase (non-hydrolysing)